MDRPGRRAIEIGEVKYLLHLPFIFFAIWLGGVACGGSRGGCSATRAPFYRSASIASAQPVVQFAVVPNNDDILAMWGLYGLIYAAIGVAHALQGPRRKWKPQDRLSSCLRWGSLRPRICWRQWSDLSPPPRFCCTWRSGAEAYVMQIMIFSALAAAGDCLRLVCLPAGSVQLCLHRRRGAILVFV